jgi:hypothetical protein
MIKNRGLANTLGALALLALLGASIPPSLAHHGWNWTTGESIEISGTIIESRLGNPHGTLIMEVEGERWSVEVGQPWRNERAGISDDDLAPGASIRVSGEPARDADEKRLKARSVWIDGNLHELYPTR